jgi:hypothetical protein
MAPGGSDPVWQAKPFTRVPQLRAAPSVLKGPMQRLSIAAVTCLALVLAPAAHAAGARPRPQAVLVSCDRAGQSAVFEGRMSAGPHTARMQMRFVLQDHTAGQDGWARAVVPHFSAWQSSTPGHSRYVYTKKVQALVGPASYRVSVRYRWLDANGTLLRRATAVSKACRQPDPRADLSVTGLAVRPAVRPDRLRYALTVLNSGRSDAPATRVALDLGDGSAPLSRPVGPLAAGASRTVVIAGPACVEGMLLTATADATDLVDEHDETDDVLAVGCPAPTA